MLQSNAEEPESILYDFLKNSSIKFIDNQIIVAKRICPKSSKQIYSLFFNPIDSNNIQYFENFLSANFGKSINLKIWNDSPNNGKVISTEQNSKFNQNDSKLLNKLTKGQWTSIGYLIKQATNEFASMHDTTEKNLIIVAPMPLESKGQEIDPNVWKSLSNLKNINVFYIYTRKSRLNKIDNALKYGFNKSASKFIEIKL